MRSNPMHAGIVRSKVVYTVSGKLQYDGPDQLAWEKFYNNGAKTHKDKNMDKVAKDTSLGYEKSNLFAYKVILSKLQEEPTLRKIRLIPFESIRFEIKEADDGKTEVLTGRILVSKDWSDKDAPIKPLEPYDPKNKGQKVFYVLHMEESGQSLDTPNAKKVNPGVYPDPPYGGSIMDIDTGIQISVFNNSEIHNGFSLGNLLNLNNGKPKNEEDQKKLEKGLEEAATGAVQAGRTLVLYNNGKDREASVITLNGNNLPDRYMNTKKGSEDSIAHGHSVTAPVLFGIKHEGSLGNSTELLNGYAVMQGNYFESRRTDITDVLNWIGKTFAGLQGEITFGQATLNLDTNIIEEDDKFGQALNDMSPLVATKVLDRATPNEIRGLGKLPPKEGGDDLPTASPVVMSEEDEKIIMDRFNKNGRSKTDFKVLYSLGFTDQPIDDELFFEEFKKGYFQNLGDNQLQALNLISQGEDFNTIRKALDISGPKLAAIYKRLSDLEMITSDGDILDAGAAEIVASDVEKMEILFEYRLRPNAPDLLPGGESRDFCQTLIGLNRLYTREEIAIISGAEGYDVFRYRGGWYHNPNTDKNEPGCRHEWAQVITFQ